jgi:hypothetical protein
MRHKNTRTSSPATPATSACSFFKEPAQRFYELSGHIRFGQPALQHRDRGQEIVASGSQISGEDRVGDVRDIGDTRPLLLVSDVGVEKLNVPTQISGERLQFHGGAGIVQ